MNLYNNLDELFFNYTAAKTGQLSFDMFSVSPEFKPAFHSELNKDFKEKLNAAGYELENDIIGDDDIAKIMTLDEWLEFKKSHKLIARRKCKNFIINNFLEFFANIKLFLLTAPNSDEGLKNFETFNIDYDDLKVVAAEIADVIIIYWQEYTTE